MIWMNVNTLTLLYFIHSLGVSVLLHDSSEYDCKNWIGTPNLIQIQWPKDWTTAISYSKDIFEIGSVNDTREALLFSCHTQWALILLWKTSAHIKNNKTITSWHWSIHLFYFVPNYNKCCLKTLCKTMSWSKAFFPRVAAYVTLYIWIYLHLNENRKRPQFEKPFICVSVGPTSSSCCSETKTLMLNISTTFNSKLTTHPHTNFGKISTCVLLYRCSGNEGWKELFLLWLPWCSEFKVQLPASFDIWWYILSPLIH